MSDHAISMSGPDITEAEIKAVEAVLRTSYLSLGPRIGDFEERFAACVGARHSVGVSSGTAGLHLCVIAALRGEASRLRASTERSTDCSPESSPRSVDGPLVWRFGDSLSLD